MTTRMLGMLAFFPTVRSRARSLVSFSLNLTPQLCSNASLVLLHLESFSLPPSLPLLTSYDFFFFKKKPFPRLQSKQRKYPPPPTSRKSPTLKKFFYFRSSFAGSSSSVHTCVYYYVQSEERDFPIKQTNSLITASKKKVNLSSIAAIQ